MLIINPDWYSYTYLFTPFYIYLFNWIVQTSSISNSCNIILPMIFEPGKSSWWNLISRLIKKKLNLQNKMVCAYPRFLLILFFKIYVFSFDRKFNHEYWTQILIPWNNFIRYEETSSYNPIIIAKVISNVRRLAMHTQNIKK